MNDFAATANLISQLDVVISVCTSVAHLGGSIGSETWIILPKDADWRWLRGRSDTPWYPSVRLFRQEKLDDWVDVVTRVKEALKARVGLEEW